MVELLIKEACFLETVNNVGNIKKTVNLNKLLKGGQLF
jgi:hypothetical protein